MLVKIRKAPNELFDRDFVGTFNVPGGGFEIRFIQTFQVVDS